MSLGVSPHQLEICSTGNQLELAAWSCYHTTSAPHDDHRLQFIWQYLEPRMLQAGAIHVLVFLGDKDVTAREICRISLTLEEYGRQPLSLFDTRNTEGLSALVVAEQDFVQHQCDFLVYPFDNWGRRQTDGDKWPEENVW